jgi:hypothetical protein
VYTAEALAKVLSPQKPEYTFRTDAARLRARRALIAEPVQEEDDGWLEWRTPPDEEVDDVLA